MTTCMMPPTMYAWDGYFLCVGVVYMWVFIVQVSPSWNPVFIGMTCLANVFPPPKKARPSQCPPNQENYSNSKHGTATHQRKYGKIKTGWSLLVGRFYNLRPSSTSAFLIGVHSIISSNMDSLFPKTRANTNEKHEYKYTWCTFSPPFRPWNPLSQSPRAENVDSTTCDW